MTRGRGGRVRRALAVAAFAASAACHVVIGIEQRSVGDAAPPRVPAQPVTDAGAGADGDAASGAPCDPARPFGEAEPLAALNSVAGEFGATLSEDELELFYTTTEAGRAIVHRAVRARRTDPFPAGVAVDDLRDIPAPHWSVALSRDGLTLYVTARTPPRALFRATRAARGATFAPAEPVPLALGDGGLGAEQVFATTRGALYLGVQGGPQIDLYVAPPADGGGGFATPMPLLYFNTLATEAWPVESFDGLVFMFAAGDGVESEIVEARRDSLAVPFVSGKALSFPSSRRKHPLWLSPDGCRLYLSQDNAAGGQGGADLWVASRP